MASRTAPIALPLAEIRKLGPADFPEFTDHLLRLDEESRRLRFSGTVSDRYLLQYALTAFTTGNALYGAFTGGRLRASAEIRALGPFRNPEAEVAFTVEADWQQMGLGSRLMERVLAAAGRREIRRVHVVCLNENRRMRHLAEKFEGHLLTRDGETSDYLIEISAA